MPAIKKTKSTKKVVKKEVPKSMAKEKVGLVQTNRVLTAEGYRRKFLTKPKKG